MNSEADKLSKDHCNAHCLRRAYPRRPYLRLYFDGSNDPSKAGGGWILYGSDEIQADAETEWQVLAWKSFAVDSQTPSSAAIELEAALCGISFIKAYLAGAEIAAAFLEEWKPTAFPERVSVQFNNML